MAIMEIILVWYVTNWSSLKLFFVSMQIICNFLATNTIVRHYSDLALPQI